MTEEASLKRKSPDPTLEDHSNEPQSKIMKGESETSKHNLESSSEVQLEDSPLEDKDRSISIRFHSEAIAELYKAKFRKFIDSFVELQVRYEDEFCIDVYKVEAANPDVIDELDKPTSADVVVETNTDLIVETDTSVLIEAPVSTKKRKKRSKVKKELFVVDANPSPHLPKPDLRYTPKFTVNTEQKTEETEERVSKQKCFNCGDSHALKDCPVPKDYMKINAARQKFKQLGKSSRYHLEEEQKYKHLEPGKPSEQLRKALGLYKHEAPHYIYLMRKFGYPPGWLEEAKVVHSNLDMFDIDGKNLKVKRTKKGGLDPDKIIEYPGFNVAFEEGIKDDHRKYGVPPFSDDFSKHAMIDYYDREVEKEDDTESCDMEIDNDEKKADNEEKEARDSPSLIDLEQQKLQLLEALNDDDGNKKSKSQIKVKTSQFGTPILKSNSPYLHLPNADNFSKDVSPVINFENLPNSTGKYEQMTDVLQKVRTTLKKINSCDA